MVNLKINCRVPLIVISVCFIATSSFIMAKSALENALGEAQNALKTYKATNPSSADKADVAEYLTYYRSWYQAVRPASVELIERIKANQATQTYIDMLKLIVKKYRFVQRPSGLMGASKLSSDGNTFYQEVINSAQKALR